jgi:hypothetical protein
MLRSPLLPLLSCAALAVLWSAAARADDKAQCFDAASQGQTLRDQHKLVDARAEFTICARTVCPKQVSKDCTGWLEQVERALPTVVLAARDEAGHDVLDVTITVDGKPFAGKLLGEAVPVDPGVHVFHFETASGAKGDQQLLVREGVKNQAITVTVAAAPGPAPTPTPTPTPGVPASPPPAAPAAPDHETPATGAAPWRTIGFVAGGVGAAGLALGAVFGVLAMNHKNDAQCDATNACKPGPLSDARSAATVSTIGFVAGGVLAAGGVALVLWAPGARAPDTQALRLVPAVGARDAALLLTGRW